MEVTGSKQTIERARRLRRSMTKPERLLWWALRKKQTDFYFRQHPAGSYVLDFYCDAVRLCVEVDGQSHDFTFSADDRRDAVLARIGIRTLRVPADEVLSNLEGVVQMIVAEAHARANSA